MVMAATVPGQLAAPVVQVHTPAGPQTPELHGRGCAPAQFDDAALARLLDPGARFPGVDLVAAAAGLFPRDVVHSGLLDGWREGRDFLLQVGPGTIGVRTSDGERRARSEAADPAGVQRATGDDLTLGDLLTGARLLDGMLAPGQALGAVASYGRAMADALADDDDQAAAADGRARLITEWSAKSRRSMTRCLAELDYAPMFAAGATPAMVTVTYPGDWRTVAPGGSVVKAHLGALLRRWARAWHVCSPGCTWQPRKGRVVPAVKRGTGRWSCTRCRTLNTGCTCGPSTVVRWAFVHADTGLPPHLWKQEFQRRGAPHLHLFAVPPTGTAPAPTSGTLARVGYVAAGQPVAFPEWLSLAWADVVAHPDPEQRRRHLLAGTGVDYKEGARATDPKRLAVYFTKHGGAAGGKEYQHRVPAAWLLDAAGRTPADEGYTFPADGPGRFWGYSGLDRVRAEVLIDRDRYLRARRTLRRLAAAKGMTRTVRVPRRQPDANGVVTGRRGPGYRTVTRRTGYLTHGGLAGGWLCVNDGPGTASALARWLVEDEPADLAAPAPWGPPDVDGRIGALMAAARRRARRGSVGSRLP